MEAKEFLEKEGINLFQTALFTIIDGCVRQPDLCWLMECYANEKMAELIEKFANDKEQSKDDSQ